MKDVTFQNPETFPNPISAVAVRSVLLPDIQ
jgi:hypothetical protein